MRILSVGAISNRSARRGVTLLEMVVVVTIISLMIGVSVPAINSGIESLRLNSALNGIATFVNQGLARAERREQVVEVSISKEANAISMRASDPGFDRKFAMPEGITIQKVLPELPDDSVVAEGSPRIFMLYPGGTVPPFGVQVTNRRHDEKVVQVDPMTGVAIVGPAVPAEQ